jgi:hypothetical protein
MGDSNNKTNLIERALFLFQPPGSDGPDLLQVRSKTYAHHCTTGHSKPAQFFLISELFCLMPKKKGFFNKSAFDRLLPHIKKFSVVVSSYQAIVRPTDLVVIS